MDDKLILSDNNRMLLSAWSKAAWGFDMVERAELILQKDEIIRQKDEIIRQKDETIKLLKEQQIQRQETIKLLEEQQIQQINHLYNSGKMIDLNELAAFFNVEVAFVKEVLKNR